MNDAELLELVAETDLLRPGAALPGSAWSRPVTLREIERRMGMDTKNRARDATESMTPREGGRALRRRWSGALVGVAAFVVVLAAVAAVLAVVTLTRDGDVASPSDEPVFGDESALATARAYLAAEAGGDREGALALMTPQLREGLGGYIEQLIVYQDAVEVTIANGDCSATGGPNEVLVECTRQSSSYLDRAVGSPGTDSIVTMTVTPEGIARIFEAPAEGSTDPVFDGFRTWMTGAHPEEALRFAAMFDWPSVEAAMEAGETITQYADEYAAFLEANGCRYDTSCTAFGVDVALARADEYFAAFSAGDVPSILGLFTQTRPSPAAGSRSARPGSPGAVR